MKTPLALLALLSACQGFSFRKDGRPCSADTDCIPGWVCSPRNATCVPVESAAALPITNEIPCNAIDEDNNGEDATESGTVNNCAKCGDSCLTANVAAATCTNKACVITACVDQFSNVDGNAKNGCEANCPDIDNDGVCDSADPCLDFDKDGFGKPAATGCAHGQQDSDDQNANKCIDTDADGCDDCALGLFSVTADGTDANSDGFCDSGDPDMDGVLSGDDPAPADPLLCGDHDGDSCDDCDPTPSAQCLAADPDNDGRPNGTDSAPTNRFACADTDGDGCDDCVNGLFSPNDDGTDVDQDGICVNMGPSGDCDDGIPTCAHDCTTNSDPSESVSVPDCYEKFCESDASIARDVCYILGPTGITGINALTATTGAVNTPVVHALIGRKGGPATFTLTEGVTLGRDGIATRVRQRLDTSLVFNFPTGGTGITAVSDGEVDLAYLRVKAGGAPSALVDLNGTKSHLRYSTIDGADLANIGVLVTGVNALIAGNVLLSAGNTAGILVANDNAVITDTIVRQTPLQGPAIIDATGDSLTVAFSTLRGGAASESMRIGPTGNFPSTVAISQLCVRNNIMIPTTPFVFRVASEVSALSLDAGCSSTGNKSAGPAACTGDMLCSQLPVAQFEEFFSTTRPLLAPNGTGGAPGTFGFSCIAATGDASINVSDPILFDRNGDMIGDYNGDFPEPGARERGTLLCP